MLFLKIMVFNRSRMDPKKHEEMMRAGLLHLRRSCALYRDQIKDGLFFLHEVPNGSSSIYETCLDSLIKDPGVYLVKGPMCAWGMTSTDKMGEGLVKKGNVLGHEL